MAIGGLPDKLYLSMHFDYTSASGWQGETAQMGLRLGIVPTVGAPDMGEIFTLPTATSVKRQAVQGSDATWNYSCNWEAQWGTDPDNTIVGLAEQADMAADVLTFWNSVRTKCFTGVRLVGVKIAPVQPDGSYSYGASEWRLKTPSPGGTGGAMPPETSIAMTIMADIIGRRGRGRMFLPGLATTTASSLGKISSTVQTDLTTSLKALIDNLQNFPGVPRDDFPCVVVCSNNDHTAIRPQTVRVGDHFDVQRRRQHQVTENMVYLSL